MDTIRQAEADRVYEDFEPSHKWDDGRFTVLLPGFRKDQMKVQVTSKPALRLMGERPTFQNRWRRFKLEFPVPSDYDTDSVTATFEGGLLTVKLTKLTKPKETTTNPEEPSQKIDERKGLQEGTAKAKEQKKETNETTTNPPEEAPGPKEPSQKTDEQEGTPKAKEEKAETKTNEVSDQNTPTHKEKDSITEKSKTEIEASMDKVAEKVRTNGSTEKTDAATSKVPKTKDAKFVARSKTRLVDFTLPKALSSQDENENENENENEALGDSTRSLKKWKKLVAWVMLILLVVGLGLYCRNTFGSSQGFDFEEMLLFPY
ncbi:unnamed protein product [Lathyrus oleraceus]